MQALTVICFALNTCSMPILSRPTMSVTFHSIYSMQVNCKGFKGSRIIFHNMANLSKDRCIIFHNMANDSYLLPIKLFISFPKYPLGVGKGSEKVYILRNDPKSQQLNFQSCSTCNICFFIL